MKLRNPGPVQSAPVLEGAGKDLAETIGGWPGVASFAHWRLGAPGVVDGAEFHVGDPELGHIHLDGTAHIPFSRAIAARLVEKGLGRTPSWSDEWIACPVRSERDVRHAAWLFRLAYDRIGGAADAALIARVASERDGTGA